MPVLPEVFREGSLESAFWAVVAAGSPWYSLMLAECQWLLLMCHDLPCRISLLNPLLLFLENILTTGLKACPKSKTILFYDP